MVRTQGQPGMQGYNAQLAVNDRQIIVAAEITTESPDFGHLEPSRPAPRRAAGPDRRDVLVHAPRARDTPTATTSTRQRQITVEPVFGQIKFNRAIKRLQRRGRTACRSKWRLVAATDNLLKLHNHRLAAATP